MSDAELPLLHVICGNDRDGDPRVHAFIDRMMESGVSLDAIFVDPTRHTDLGSWTSAVIEQLLERADVGRPVHLLGYCSGGDVVLEMLDRLPSLGVDLGYVGFIDTRQSPPALRIRKGDYSRFRMRWSWRIREQIGRLGPPESAPVLSWIRSVAVALATGPATIIGRRIRNRRRHGLFGHGRWKDARWMTAHLAHDWRYPRVTVPAHLYTTRDSMERFGSGDPSLGLADHLRGGFSVELIPGDHFSCLQDPNLDPLIALIGRDRSAVGEVGTTQA